MKQTITSIISIILITLFYSCDADVNLFDQDFSQIENPRERWEAYKIEDYVITERYGCFCAGVLEWDVVVKDTIKDEVFFDENLLIGNQSYETIFEKAKTINDVFDFIDTFDISGVAEFTVEYDVKYGYPSSIYIDYDLLIADDEINYIYSNLNKLY